MTELSYCRALTHQFSCQDAAGFRVAVGIRLGDVHELNYEVVRHYDIPQPMFVPAPDAYTGEMVGRRLVAAVHCWCYCTPELKKSVI